MEEEFRRRNKKEVSIVQLPKKKEKEFKASTDE
jgi:hypothetical protein